MAGEAYRSPISKKLDQIHVQNADVGIPGKFYWPMYVQTILAVYYIATWPIQLDFYFNFYYTEDDEKETSSANPFVDSNATHNNITSTNDTDTDHASIIGYNGSVPFVFEFIRSDVLSFQCNDKTFYLEGTGPHPEYDSSLNTSSTTGIMLFEPGTGSSYGSFVGMMVIILFAYIMFIAWNLYKGQYNMVTRFVTFTRDEPKKPVKFGIGFTLMCNLAAGYGNFMMQDACGYMAQGPSENFTTETGEYILILLYGVSYLGLMLWMYTWLITCGSCVMCCKKSFLWLRRLLAVGIGCSYILRFLNLEDFELQFDFDFPMWAAFSVVSTMDLIASTIMDIYLGCCCCIPKQQPPEVVPDQNELAMATPDIISNSDAIASMASDKVDEIDSRKEKGKRTISSGVAQSLQSSVHNPESPAHSGVVTVTEMEMPDGSKIIQRETSNADGSKTIQKTIIAQQSTPTAVPVVAPAAVSYGV